MSCGQATGQAAAPTSPVKSGVVIGRLAGGLLLVRLADGSSVNAEDRSATAYRGAAVGVALTQNGWRVL